MNCEQFSTLMQGYLEGTLDQQQYPMAKAHVEQCPHCQLRLQILKDCQSLDEDGEVPASFSSSWRQAMKQQEEHVMTEQDKTPKPRKTRQLNRFIAIAASLVLVIGGAWMVGRQPARTPTSDYVDYEPYQSREAGKATALRSEPAPGMVPSAIEADSFAMDAQPAAAPEPEQAQAKIIRTVSLRIATPNFDEDLEKLNLLLKEKGGYVEYSDISADAGTRRYATFTLRVPKAQLDAYLAGAQGVGRTLSFSESQEDVSEQYLDTDTRLATQKAKMERLQALISKALLVDDILRIEREIADTQYQIDRLTGSLRGMDSKVDYSTVSLHLSEQRAAQESPTYTLGQRIVNAMTDAWSAVQEFLEEALIGLVVIAPYIVVLAVIVFIVVRVIKRRRKK